jgi:hypothetical protein
VGTQRENGPVLSKPLRRDIALSICVKVAALIVIYRLFFAPYEAPPLSRAAVSAHILGPAAGH